MCLWLTIGPRIVEVAGRAYRRHAVTDHGKPLFDVSRILDHAQIGTTADIYGHLVPEMTAGAASRMDALLKTKAK